MSVNNTTKEIKFIEENVIKCNQFINENKENEQIKDFENRLRQIKKSVSKITMLNIINIIDRVVEDGSKSLDGRYRQFNINSIHASSEDVIYLIAHEIIGFDEIDKKYVLDNEKILINFEDILRIY